MSTQKEKTAEDQLSKKRWIAAAGIATLAVAVTATTASGVFAQAGKEKREAVEQALEANDFTAFQEAAQNTPLADRITQENFTKFQELHSLKEQVRILEEELGLERGHHKGQRKGQDGEKRKAVEAAIESGDFTAFQEATKDSPQAGEITEEQFAGMQEVHSLKEAGDHEAAKAKADELGLKKPHGKKGPR